MKHEFRCVECNWLDPKLWSNLEHCGCNHYWEHTEKRIESTQFSLFRAFRALPLSVWNGDCE